MNQYAINAIPRQEAYMLDVNYMPIVPFGQQEDANEADLDGAINAATKRIQEANDLALTSMLEHAAALGAMKTTLRWDRKELKAENILLESHIEQLKISCEEEFDSFVAVINASINALCSDFKSFYDEIFNINQIALKLLEPIGKIDLRWPEGHKSGVLGEAQLRYRFSSNLLSSLDPTIITYKKVSEDCLAISTPIRFEVPIVSSISKKLQIIDDPQHHPIPQIVTVNPIFHAFEQDFEQQLDKLRQKNARTKNDNQGLENKKIEIKENHNKRMTIYSQRIWNRLSEFYRMYAKMPCYQASSDSELRELEIKHGGFAPHYVQWVTVETDIAKNFSPYIVKISNRFEEIQKLTNQSSRD